MKKKFISIVILLVYGITNAQNTLTLDQQLVNVNQSSVSSGIIYERVPQFANLYNFNKSPDFNVADFKYFKQALSEMYRASNSTKFTTLTNFKNLINGTTLANEVDIALLSTQFHVLNYNKDDTSLGGLTYDESTQKYNQIPNKVPFYMLDNTVISTTKDYASGTSITYKLRNDLYFKNGTKTIQTLVADFGDGVNRALISNGILTNQNIVINYNSSGEKRIKFTVTYNDNSTLETYCKIYFKYINSTASLINSTSTSCDASDPLRQDYSLQADIPFTGFVSGDPTIKAKIDYRVFFSNGNTQKLIKKPIIIIDGFDPGDKRKIEDCDCENDASCSARNTTNGVFDPAKHKSILDMMTYKNNLGADNNLLPELRTLGYDVIVVNQPTYTTTNIQNGQSVTIDGGAYYIESNAMAMVKLITQVRQALITNNSTSQIAIVGPSMGGQISRYALAYMEKNNIPHNVYLWVSVDSPHLGANIPMGDQALINLLKTESNSADEFYNNELSSPAAQEQLIEFHREGIDYNTVNPTYLNGQTTSQGLATNAGNNLYQQHYNNQNNNGLPGSHGFPVNLRKISLVNGSVTGKTFGNDSENVLTIKAFERVHVPLLIGQYSFTVHLATLESDFMPATGNSAQIAYFNKKGNTKNTISPNLNLRGNMDIVPGGFFGAQNDINQSITGQGVFQTRGSFWQFTMDNLIYFITSINGSGGYWETREFKPIHSFIPTFSSIAHKQPNQNWGNKLDRNLVCSNETYFDSYFGHDENTQHTSFDNESVIWLKKELAGQPQAPYFPIQENVLTGPSKICANNNTTYSISDVCKVPSPVMYTQGGNTINGWSVQGNLQIVSTTPYSITVVGTSDDPNDATITATFQNGQTIQIPVHVGTPKAENTTISNSWDWVSINGGSYNMSVPADPTATSYYWTAEADVSEFPMMCPTINAHHGVFIGGINSGNISSITTTTPTATINWGNCLGTYILTCYAVNDCGMTPYSVKFTTVGKPQNNPCTHKPYGIKIAPNPIESGRTNFVVSKIRDASPCNFAKIEEGYVPKTYVFYEKSSAMVSIYDFSGNQVYSNVFPEPEYIEIKELPKEDETNPEEVKKYEELNHYNIQGLDLNPGFYFIRVKDSDDDSEGATVQVEVK